MSRPEIPAVTKARQALAGDPGKSAWVSANAGSGKTFVLARRVVRLLLAGSEPSRILCLTFTKAAAAEMAARVFDTLGAWTSLDDARLADELQEIEGTRPDAGRLARARHLFAKALETPGGLKIQTIHAFCEALLHQFPLEANVAGHFTVLDDRISAELLAEARSRVLARAENEPESPAGRALAFLITELSDTGVEAALDEMVGKRDRLRRWLTDFGSLDEALADLARHFGVDPGDTLERIDAEFHSGCGISEARMKAYAAALLEGGVSDSKLAAALERSAAGGGASWRGPWLDIFLTKDLAARKKLVSKAVAEKYPDVPAALEEEQARLLSLLDRRRTILTIEGTSAILRISDEMLAAYEREKIRRGVLDFEDLVVRTANLLARSDAALWVQYKLDQGLDHILVDEAQDTSPRQWEVIQALVEDFFSGEGARQSGRTVFAVGDEKQSIYSFQGAEPAYFARMRRDFAKKAERAAQAFETINLTLSFRSTQDVLGAVDEVFQKPAARKGLSQDGEAPVHEAVRRNDPGLVEIWPLEVAEEREVSDDWSEPIDRVAASDPMMRVARRIASAVDGWRHTGEAAPGDVLVLVRKRGPFVDALTRELKRLDVPVAGSDRLVLTDHIVVKDLVALGRFLLLAEDDLSLAAVLKSPLFGVDDDGLFQIARDGADKPRAGTLWQSLVRHAGVDPAWAARRDRLEDWRSRADFVPPFEFYARLLGTDGGRRQFKTRMGTEVDDVIDEFLALTIAFEQTGTPGLEGFLAWLAAAPTEIKRELASAEGVVRIMTVHGAKGLEAPVVILADPGASPVSSRHDPVMLDFPRDASGHLAPALVWLPVKADRTPWHETALAELHERSEEEYRRLLYVAMTRAKDRLVVCGWTGKRGLPAGTWYGLVRDALESGAREETEADGSLHRLLWRKPGAVEGLPIVAGGKAGEGGNVPADANGRPLWLDRQALPPERIRRLQPSRAFETMETKETAETPTGQMFLDAARQPADWPLERGRLVHRMLQTLPDVGGSDRRATATRYLDRFLPSAFTAYRDGLIDEVCAILDHPGFAPVFSAAARVEVPVIGRLTASSGEEVAVSGQIDRLFVTESEVLIVDYKTNRAVPASVDGTPGEYVTQLGVYRRLLLDIFSGRRVRAALLWTAAPSLMEIPAEMLDEAVEKLR